MHGIFLFFTRNFLKFFINPTKNSEDDRRREFILNTLLSASIVVIGILEIRVIRDILIYKDKYHGISIGIFSFIFIFLMFLLYISRKGFLKEASYGLLLIYSGGAIYSAYLWGFDLPNVILGYVLVIAISSILISIRFSLFTTTLLCISIILIGYYQLNVKTPEHDWRKDPPLMADTASYIIILYFIAFIYWLSNRETEKSLERARHSENELAREKDILENKVEERTKEIKIIQMERMSELYRFVEFGKISSGAFHDLINPLTSIHFLINEIQYNNQYKISEVNEYIDRAILVSKRMQSFIEALRKKIRYDHKKVLFKPKQEIEEALLLLAYKIKKFKCEVIITENKKHEAFGNPLAFYQIITNLISNAIDSYEGIDSINKLIMIDIKNTKLNLEITVKDYGAGIKSDIIPRLFEPFFTTKESGKGIGLGLSTTKHIIEKEFKGNISVKTETSKGTTFTILIPLTEKNSHQIKTSYRHFQKRRT